MSNLNADTLERLRVLLEEKMKGHGDGACLHFGVCHAIAFAPLLALVREKCRHQDSAWHDTGSLVAFCPTCRAEWEPSPGHLTPPVSYATRTAYWQDAPEGAWRGAIREVLIEHEGLLPELDEYFFRWSDEAFTQTLIRMVERHYD